MEPDNRMRAMNTNSVGGVANGSGASRRGSTDSLKDWAMRMTVVVPTYRRPADLDRCLRALGALSRPADEVIVVSRAEDTPTQEVLDRHASALPMKRVRA